MKQSRKLISKVLRILLQQLVKPEVLSSQCPPRPEIELYILVSGEGLGRKLNNYLSAVFFLNNNFTYKSLQLKNRGLFNKISFKVIY
jgi:hypothetical protein